MFKVEGIPLNNYEYCIDIKFKNIDFEELKKIRTELEEELNCADSTIEALGFNVYAFGYKLLKLSTNKPVVPAKERVLQIIDDIAKYKYEVVVSKKE